MNEGGETIGSGYPESVYNLRKCPFQGQNVKLSIEQRAQAKTFIRALCEADPFTRDNDGYIPQTTDDPCKPFGWEINNQKVTLN